MLSIKIVTPIAALVAFSLYSDGQKAQPAPAKGWTANLAKALKDAKKSHKLVMVDFNATWCGPCRMYQTEVFPTASFKRETKNVVLVTVDVDAQRELALKYKVSSIPDIRFLSPNGKEVGRLIGYGGEQRLIGELAKARRAAKL
ncbi:MAG: thioredoxin family protein [Fimbriimonas ginsengisoli]|uniref:Thioredoxin family protein n=1 Tax=Fimbriimonas ginsengisoli TaxID=1005039 RepID=A0A931LVG3_FIMGI|nr:thioredoxin family protein [Fimbriimonas ginsengisoli]